MKIAQLAPLFESVPPVYYGGTERVVSYLTEELVRQGHEVTLFASGDSVTSARLESVCDRAMRLDKQCVDQLSPHLLMVERALQQAGSFDLIHAHIDFLPFSLFRRTKTPCVTTLHGRLDLPELVPLFNEFSDIPVISISNAQRSPLPQANWQGTVYHGLPAQPLTFHPNPGRYLAFLGRLSAEKRVDRALEIARRVGLPLKVAAKIDPCDREYYRTVAEPLMGDPLVQFIGEIGEKDKDAFLGNASALLFPIDWPEPFGMVMIEAMACGTPVIAYDGGSVREIVDPGVTGFIVHSIDEAVRAVERVPSLSRTSVRQRFEKRFTAARMAADYVSLYQKLIDERADAGLRILPTSLDAAGASA